MNWLKNFANRCLDFLGFRRLPEESSVVDHQGYFLHKLVGTLITYIAAATVVLSIYGIGALINKKSRKARVKTVKMVPKKAPPMVIRRK